MEVRAVCTEEELAQHRKWKWINFQKPNNRSWHSFCLLVWSGRFYFWPDPVFLSGSGSDNLLANLKDKITTPKLMYCGKIDGQYFFVMKWVFFPSNWSEIIKKICYENIISRWPDLKVFKVKSGSKKSELATKSPYSPHSETYGNWEQGLCCQDNDLIS